MNIIVPSQEELRFVNYSSGIIYDINTIYFYIENGLEPALTLKYKDINDFDKSYDIPLIEDSIEEAYHIYKTNSEIVFPVREYNCELTYTLNGESILKTFQLQISNEFFTDQHAPILIEKRKMILDKADLPLLLEEDCLSECMTFKIEKFYDGVSFFDDNKNIFVDYVPAKFSPDEKDIFFFSDEIHSKTEIIENDVSYLLLKWIIPQRALRDAGTLKIALSVQEPSDLENAYIWQTLPVSLTIEKNIGSRTSYEPTPDIVISLSSLAEAIQEINDYLNELKTVDIDTTTGTFKKYSGKQGVVQEENISIIDLFKIDAEDEDVFFDGRQAEEAK